MHVLKLTLGKIIFLQIFLQFLFFSVKHPDGLLLRPDGCSSTECLCGIPCPDRLVLHPDRYRTGLSIVFSPSRLTPFRFSIVFLSFCCDFLVVSRTSSAYFCPFLSFISFPGMLLYTLLSFQLF
jgi:hypothetical protein